MQNHDIYTAIELTPDDQCRLMSEYFDLFNVYLEPTGFMVHTKTGKRLGNHMTLNLGRCRDRSLLGEHFILTIDGLGFSDRAIAVRVGRIRHVISGNREDRQGIKDVECDRPIPHITLFINPRLGGKPSDSNRIITWLPVREGMDFRGVVTELNS